MNLEPKYYDPFREALSWRVARDGYAWVNRGALAKARGETVMHLNAKNKNNTPFDEPYLVEGPAFDGYEPYLISSTGDEPGGRGGRQSGLCYAFADLKPTQEEFLGFVSRWGLPEVEEWVDWSSLDGWQERRLPFSINGKPVKPDLRELHPTGISLKRLLEIHADLSFACTIWRLLADGNTERLSEVIKPERSPSNEIVVFFEHRYSTVLWERRKRITKDDKHIPFDVAWGDPVSTGWSALFIDSHLWREMSEVLRPSDVTGPARILLRNFINHGLRESVKTGLIVKPDYRGFIPATRAVSLLGAMWLQLFHDVCGERPLARCEICGEWDDKKRLRAGRYHRSCYSTMKTKEYRAAAKAAGEDLNPSNT